MKNGLHERNGFPISLVMMRRLLSVLLIWAVLLPTATATQERRDLSLADVLASASAAVSRYFASAQSIMFTETIVQQGLAPDMMSSDLGFARRLVFDSRVTWDPRDDGGVPEARFERQLVLVNGRAPRPKDKTQCFDPPAVNPDALAMLLEANHGDYLFSLAGRARLNKREAVLLDYRERQTGPITVRKRDGVDGCFFVEMPGRSRGRIWLDRETFEVLRIDERLSGPVDVRQTVRDGKKRDAIDTTFSRHESSTTYQPITFTDPDETLMLPSVISTISAQTGSRQRKTQSFSNYRRFVTEGRIVQ